jgi:hypothetical protein
MEQVFPEIVHSFSRKEAHFFEKRFRKQKCNKAQKSMLRSLSFLKCQNNWSCHTLLQQKCYTFMGIDVECRIARARVTESVFHCFAREAFKNCRAVCLLFRV